MYYQSLDMFGEVNPNLIVAVQDDGVPMFVPNDRENRDWQAYQAWLAQGNAPLPAKDLPQ